MVVIEVHVIINMVDDVLLDGGFRINVIMDELK
jgi:hypothetical protein